ncbi:MAG: translation initiation factor [Cyclobacteriaceae bacterium]
MAKKNTFKNREGVVYSTDPDFNYQEGETDEPETLAPNQQKLIVKTDKKSRGGKTATLVEGFVGKENDLTDLSKWLKSRCGVGGSAKDQIIIIQGDLKDKIFDLLTGQGYKVKKSG